MSSTLRQIIRSATDLLRLNLVEILFFLGQDPNLKNIMEAAQASPFLSLWSLCSDSLLYASVSFFLP
jgi:hypothetical protein